MKKLWASLVLATLTIPVWGAVRTVTLAVPGMTCAACPITVKQALSRVVGVNNVEVSFKKRQATVTFDDARTDVESLTRATRNAGYPSSVKKE